MVKANSLLYAVYVCLLIGLLLSGLLLLSNLYNQLNLFYTTHESLYVNNLSTINYALGNQLIEEPLTDENTGIQSSYFVKKHGLQTVLLTQSSFQNDTVKSAHIIGQKLTNSEALYVANFTQPLNFSGTVKIKGTTFLPSERVKEIYIENKPNLISLQGTKKIATIQLPKLSEDCYKIFENKTAIKTTFKQLEAKKDSVYFNSFFNEIIEIELTTPFLDNKIIKGNFILSSNDSIVIRKSTILEDVIVRAPKVTIEAGFKGSLQVLAKERIFVGKEVNLNYPSTLCLFNESEEKKGTIFIDEEVKISGLVLAFGNDLLHLENNNIELSNDNLVIGTIYSSGTIMLKGSVFGSVYGAKMIHKTTAASYSNCIADVEIDITQKPSIFVDLPIFNNQEQKYGIIKKVL